MKISDVGEFGLINIIKNMANNKAKDGIGDDCAIIDVGDNREMVVTTDTLVENIHFFSGTDAYMLGRKSLAVSLSDVAAMAAIPRWAFLSISLDDMEFDYIESFIKGFYSMADEFNVVLLGGDTTKSPVFTITVTLIGENKKGESVKRSGAKVGDSVYVSGKVGCSYAGLYAIENNFEGFDRLKAVHLDPHPRLKESMAIKSYVSAMIDISDGLLQDALHICEESGVSMRLDFNKIPFCDTELVKKEDMLSGGEDYELLFCAHREYEERLQDIENVTKIGVVEKGFGVNVIKNGQRIEIKNLGFKHF